MARKKEKNLARAGKVRNSTPKVPSHRVKKRIPRIRNRMHFAARVVGGRYAGQPGSLGAAKATIGDGATGWTNAGKRSARDSGVKKYNEQQVDGKNST
ncbi:MAG: 30S ribosomal protein S30e [Candidatus Lokiarchaeota archaeon]|nr:30S ribosomal protein S30e [Candidatus Lokiarchaeota archaeon]